MNYPTDELIEYALSFYDSNPNHYHTKFHALEVMSGVDYFLNKEMDAHGESAVPNIWSRTDVMVMKTAALFHDAEYIPGRRNNEERAVEIAVPALLKRGWRPRDVEKVRLLILSTIPFELDKYADAHKDIAPMMYVLHDLDWMGFSNWEIMVANEAKLFTEAHDRHSDHPSYDEFLKAQLAFYKKILEMKDQMGSVINRGFYRTFDWMGLSEEALDNIESRVDDIELDIQLDKINQRMKDSDADS